MKAETKKRIAQFVKHIEAGQEALLKAGKMLVGLLTEDPDIFTVIRREHRGWPFQIVTPGGCPRRPRWQKTNSRVWWPN